MAQEVTQTEHARWQEGFWRAFVAMTRRMASRDYFCEQWPEHCCDGHDVGWDERSLQTALTEHLPFVSWLQPDPPPVQPLLELVTFLHDHASKPVDGWFHQYDACGQYHPTAYDSEAGRRDFADECNRLFKRFGAPFEFRSGSLARTDSPTLTPTLDEILTFPDSDLAHLVDRAVSALKDRRDDRRIEAAEVICKAFEHTKSLEGRDFPAAVHRLLDRITNTGQEADSMGQLWSTLTTTGHELLRHSRSGAPSTSDPELAEYLFYLYFCTVRYVLKKLASSSDPQNG